MDFSSQIASPHFNGYDGTDGLNGSTCSDS